MNSTTARVNHALLALATMAVGLGVHLHGGALGRTLRDFTGDALWGAMIAWWIGAIAPAASTRDRCLAAIAVCFAVEFSQLYHTPTLDALRETTVGSLTLGSGFDPRDLLAYALGVLSTVLVERSLRRWLALPNSHPSTGFEK